MRIVVFSDIHGNDGWKWVLERMDEFDKVVFVGDYVDSFVHSNVIILHNLLQIIEFRKKYPDKVVTLLGNHDYAYIFNKYQTSGYRGESYLDVKKIFQDNWNLFDVAWGHLSTEIQDKNGRAQYTIITHAGVTNEYWSSYVYSYFCEEGSILSKMYVPRDTYFSAPVHEVLNFLKDKIDMLWVLGEIRGGVDTTGSPIWADKSELMADALHDVNQIVGHTPRSYVEKYRNKKGDDIIFIDNNNTERIHSFVLNL